MTDHVPLDHLVLNLLALVEAAPELPPETLARLADLATTVEPTVESLAAISLRINLELMHQPALLPDAPGTCWHRPNVMVLVWVKRSKRCLIPPHPLLLVRKLYNRRRE